METILGECKFLTVMSKNCVIFLCRTRQVSREEKTLKSFLDMSPDKWVEASYEVCWILNVNTQKMDDVMYWINRYPLQNNAIDFPNAYQLDGDLSDGKRYPTFEQQWPDLFRFKDFHSRYVIVKHQFFKNFCVHFVALKPSNTFFIVQKISQPTDLITEWIALLIFLQVDSPLFLTVLSLFVYSLEQWNQSKITYLKRLVVTAHARHLSPTGTSKYDYP